MINAEKQAKQAKSLSMQNRWYLPPYYLKEFRLLEIWIKLVNKSAWQWEFVLFDLHKNRIVVSYHNDPITSQRIS